MKICVVVPSKNYLSQAGSRIRYGRLRNELEVLGTTMDTEVIDQFRRGSDYQHDIYLLSKCYDARSLALAATLSCKNKRIGIDLFDDYFSQSRDSRLTHLRQWLRTIGGFLDFVVCSTPRLHHMAGQFFPDLPRLVMNDPFSGMDAECVGRLCQKKVERAQSTRTLKIGWFGMGDNPYFQVGLQDLITFSSALNRFQELGYGIELTILTNKRALVAPTLEALRWLAIPYTLDDWSEEKEQKQIADSDACFLPVNGQLFSIAKSLNRAITTLTGGAQVLSSGYPLYAPLGGFIYRDPAALVADIEAGRPALRAETIPALMQVFDLWASPSVEAGKFANFLQPLLQREPAGYALTGPRKYRTIGILHGRRTASLTHKLTQRLGHFSIGTPFSPAALHYDMTLTYVDQPSRLDLHLSEATREWLAAAFRPRLAQNQEQPNQRANLVIEGVCDDPVLLRQIALFHQSKSEVTVRTFYTPVMQSLQAILHRLFPDLPLFFSEIDSACWTGPGMPLGESSSRMAQEGRAVHEA